MRAISAATLQRLAALMMALTLASPWAHAQQPAPTYPQQELDQLLAPIALYPDALVAQILMASTYPLEVVEAARWSKANPNVTGPALEQALQSQNWDPSVKSLTAVPQVLQMMNEKLDWTQKLGDAFLAQQQDVMKTVQDLRLKAQRAGNLQTTPQQQVVTEQSQGQTIIKIEQADPQVVYVPTYNPTVVYGTWPYPAAPPYSYYPPGYVAGTALFSFAAGAIVGSALWGDFNWGGGDVNVNVNRYNNFNRANINNANWRHNVDHRRAVPYRDSGVQQRYGQGRAQNPQSREAFRGRAEQGRQQLGQGQGAQRPGERDRGGLSGQRQPGAGAGRPTQQRQPAALEGVGRGREAQSFSDRGRSSRSEMQRPASASRSGGMQSRGGGGGRAAGGGGRGGGGGGRGGGGRR